MSELNKKSSNKTLKSSVGSQAGRVPAIYRPPFGLPLRWQDDVTGELPAAVWAYIKHAARPLDYAPPTAAHLGLAVDYLRHVIEAPCWRDESGALDGLRRRVTGLQTGEDVRHWIDDCLEIGLDPL